MKSENARHRALLAWILPVLVCFTILHCSRAFGQIGSGTVNGTVTDSQGNAIVGASVSIVNTATQVVIPAKTQSDGSFSVGGLVLGPYEVIFEAQGFKKIVETNIRIEATSIVKLDETMTPGEVASTVEVNAQGAQLETETIASDTTLEQELVQNEPVVPTSGAYRDATMLVNLTPGATGDLAEVQIAGGRAMANEMLLDNVPDVYTGINSAAMFIEHPAFDIVSQVYTQPGVPTAEYGRISGGVVSELTRSGGNQWHGDAAVFLKNTIFDAKAYNATAAGKDQQYELPVSFGGPVWIPHLYDGRRRTFFFFNYTRFYNDSTGPSYATIPTLQERTGNFSDWLPSGGVIYNPSTQVAGVRQPFPSNTFTPTSTIIENYFKTLPAPTNSALTSNYLYYPRNDRIEAHWFYRIDHKITDNNSLHWTLNTGSSNYAQPQDVAQNNGGYSTNQSMSIWDDWVLTPNLLNHVSVSAIHYNAIEHDYGGSDYNIPNFATSDPTLTVPGTYPLGQYAGMPSGLSIGTYAGITVDNNKSSFWTYDYQDSVVWTKGKHTLKFGARFDAFQENIDNPANTFGLSGNFSFASGETGVGPNQTLTSTSAGNAAASALLGYVDSARVDDNVASYARSKYFAVYAQDSWRVTPRLTANLGVRWEMSTPITDAKGNMTNFDPTLPNSAAGGIPGALVYAGSGPGRIGSNSFMSIWKDGYSPRVGLAYDLHHGMVIRAGYGIMYAPYVISLGWGNYPGYSQAGFSLNSSAVSPDGGYTPAFSLDSGFPAASLVTSTTLSPTLYNGQSVSYMDTQNGKDNRLQDNQSWQLDVQKTLGSWYIDAGYVGQRGHHISQGLIGGGPVFNEVPDKYLSLGSLLTDSITDPAVVAAGYTPPYAGFTGTLAQALRPYPQYLNVSPVLYPSGSSSWDGFLFKVQQHYKNGFSLLAAYTWSKEFSNAGFTQFFGINTTQDTYNSKDQKSIGDWNIPQNLVLNYLYELPFGKGKRFLNSGPLNYFVGGFGLSAMQSYESGLPIHVTASSPNLPLFNPQVFVNIVPGVKMKLASRSQTKKYNGLYNTQGTKWLNEAAFANPAPYSYGNSRAYLDHLQNLATLNENFSFFKRTPVNADGTKYIELRFEMFNAFNRANYSGLDTTLGDPNFGEYTGEYGSSFFWINPGPKTSDIVMKIVF